MNYKGVIIEESLGSKNVLKDIVILSTKVEQVTEKHKTPWLKQWTLHTVEILEEIADQIAEKLANKSKLTQKDVEEFSLKIKSLAAKRFIG